MLHIHEAEAAGAVEHRGGQVHVIRVRPIILRGSALQPRFLQARCQ